MAGWPHWHKWLHAGPSDFPHQHGSLLCVTGGLQYRGPSITSCSEGGDWLQAAGRYGTHPKPTSHQLVVNSAMASDGVCRVSSTTTAFAMRLAK